ncbi:MAG: hypothetical protein WEB60_07705 [Terrimicrobiaceae bacterium]
MDVADLFSRLGGTHVHVLPNAGNCGDGLIHMGLHALTQKYLIPTTELLFPLPAGGRVLFVLGCGNLCRSFDLLVRPIRHYLKRFDRVYFLPCSMDPESPRVAALLGELQENVTIFCREAYSAERIAPFVSPRVSIFVDHDLAMHLDYSPWKQRGEGRLNAFRTDHEGLGYQRPPDNFDVSLLGGSSDGPLLPKIVSRYQEVHTDRAHVAITAAMLGKETHIYPNNYHKVRGIAEFSLLSMPHVHFHEAGDGINLMDSLPEFRRF